MPKQSNPAAPQKIKLIERQTLALELRKQGGTYRQIAQQLAAREDVGPNYSEGLAYRDVMQALKRLNDKQADEAALVRRLELERLDVLHGKLWANATKGDFAALDRVLTLMDKRARYLGLYDQPPIKHEVEHSGKDGGPIAFFVELDALIAQVYAEEPARTDPDLSPLPESRPDDPGRPRGELPS